MNHYFENLEEEIKQYFHILSDEIPNFLKDYVDTLPMQRLGGIGRSCGTFYSKMYSPIWYSTLDHSVGVALIIWHFTKDKKQTLAGLFHDISTPVFQHTVDFMNGDYETQESTEELTTKMITESKEIMELLERDEIKVEEVDNYHHYPIADSERPKLASDRLEYTFSDGFSGGFGMETKLWNLSQMKEVYESIEVLKNEEGIPELGFRDIKMAERFVCVASQLSSLYNINQTKFSMQFLADVMKKMKDKYLITIEDLYQFSEKEMIAKIENCEESNIAECFEIWRNATKINESGKKVEGKYCVNIEKVKVRYIDPLVKFPNQTVRVSKVSEKAKQDIEKALHFKTKKYAYLDFDFS